MRQVARAAMQLLILSSVFWALGCSPPPFKPRLVYPIPTIEQPRLEFIGGYKSSRDLNDSSFRKLADSVMGSVIEGGFSGPSGIVSDGSGVVFVADKYQKNVRVYDFDAKTAEYLTDPGVLKWPIGLALSGSGELYVADPGAGNVLVFGKSRKPLRRIGAAKSMEPSYLAINDKLGRLYVSDGKHSKIYVYSLRGDHLFTIEGHGKQEGGFFSQGGLAIDIESDELYVADSFMARVLVFDKDGEFLRTFGKRGEQANQFDFVRDLSFDPEGNLWVVDARKKYFSGYTKEGQLLMTGGGVNVERQGYSLDLAGPTGIHIDSNGRIYISETISKRFVVWQLMNEEYMQKNPFTEQDMDFYRRNTPAH